MILAGLALLLLWPVATVRAARDVTIGERPTIEQHLEQADIDSGEIKLKALLRQGRLLFADTFNRLDGQGRPATTGAGAPRAPGQPAFIRTSAPDSSSCADCHNLPRAGGAGGFVSNVFVLAQARDPVTFSVGPEDSDERNTLGMMGSGTIELLAREMTSDLIAARETARAEAHATGMPASRPLITKGVSFGSVTVRPDGRVDPSGIAGVDWDLVVKPFHQKGAVVSLREFTNNAMNHHHGMQSVERFGAGTDPDLDGVRDELTVGDITAVTVWQASLNIPGRLLPSHPKRRAAARRGEALFSSVGCASCHVASMVLNDPVFTEPNPYSPPGNLRPSDVGRPFAFDLTREGPAPRLQRLPGGRAVVQAFTDLKRHDLNDAEYAHFANEQVAQGTLAGNADPSTFTQSPAPRPKREFLTRKLWDAGNSTPYGHRGDLTTLTEAIDFHGGEARASRDAYFGLAEADRAAVVEFLKTLQVLPDGSAGIVVEHEDDGS